MTKENNKNLEKVKQDLLADKEKTKHWGLITSEMHDSPLYDQKSFGGLTIKDNFKKASLAIRHVQREHKKYGRRNSQWTIKNLTLSWDTPSRNLRQISAEVKKKEEALFEHKYKHKQNQIKVERYKRKLETEKDDLKKLELELKIEKEIVGFNRGIDYIEGALKDILILRKCYDDIVQKYGLQTEEDFEKWEQKHHIMRSIRQCVRDVRERGKITKGEQEFIEQWGGNPSYMFKRIVEHVNAEHNTDDPSGELLNKFVNDMADEFKDLNVKQLEYHGFNSNEQIQKDLLRIETKVKKED